MLQIEQQQALQDNRNTALQLTPRWLRIPQAVEYSGLGRTTIYQLMGQRKIKSRTIGTIRVVDRESIDSFMEGQPA